MKNTSIIIVISILVILSSITIAYKEEIKQFSENAIENYILEKIQTLSQEKQEDFNTFSSLSIENKFQKAWEINKQSKQDNLDNNNEALE